ncbi:hypothetical protein [Sulfolobus acidocaldarius]|uniref:Conserved protein n=3 Tax=Sulfolobus acidocaldarius TaxID=2285 RepID=Q4J765_SULAC|nr:hypothetical protein [Sulfolobus acidocaldarius]AAY81366.1 conserved protein [Sulfolobus acidocaldarius DSM 639]AGE74280.1 hypothetical protein SacRon12I_10320 [Sulfolobus acidocaldarius Ron12/I]ALU29837.1 hypothetical protein ATY89_07720 [Sulfolobus acidocaldarius]ALU32576.1 hypothetical protein ATZ20_10740 [Sulfolobus acidocaldarius]WCM35867.1 hypothetical protein GO597_11270 [Sulfolobus acidocaldarius DSM 639]
MSKPNTKYVDLTRLDEQECKFRVLKAFLTSKPIILVHVKADNRDLVEMIRKLIEMIGYYGEERDENGRVVFKVERRNEQLKVSLSTEVALPYNVNKVISRLSNAFIFKTFIPELESVNRVKRNSYLIDFKFSGLISVKNVPYVMNRVKGANKFLIKYIGFKGSLMLILTEFLVSKRELGSMVRLTVRYNGSLPKSLIERRMSKHLQIFRENALTIFE